MMPEITIMGYVLFQAVPTQRRSHVVTK